MTQTTWDNPLLQQMYFQAIRWSLGLGSDDETCRNLDRLAVGRGVDCAAGCSTAARDAAGGTRRARRRSWQRGAATKAVLAWADTRNGIAQHDSVSHALAVIERLGYESGIYDTFIRTDSSVISKHPKTTDGKPASGGPTLANVDAIFFLGHREIQLEPDQKADLLAFVKEDGKGFVAGHTATTAFASWPEFGELLGARYDGHPWNTVHGTVINEDPAFPATKHLPPAFDITEEFYQASEFSRDRIRRAAPPRSVEAAAERRDASGGRRFPAGVGEECTDRPRVLFGVRSRPGGVGQSGRLPDVLRGAALGDGTDRRRR